MRIMWASLAEVLGQPCQCRQADTCFWLCGEGAAPLHRWGWGLCPLRTPGLHRGCAGIEAALLCSLVYLESGFIGCPAPTVLQMKLLLVSGSSFPLMVLLWGSFWVLPLPSVPVPLLSEALLALRLSPCSWVTSTFGEWAEPGLLQRKLSLFQLQGSG